MAVRMKGNGEGRREVPTEGLESALQKIELALSSGDFLAVASVKNVIEFSPAAVAEYALDSAADHGLYQIVATMFYQPRDGSNNLMRRAKELFDKLSCDGKQFEKIAEGPRLDCTAVRAVAECCPESPVFYKAFNLCGSEIMREEWRNRRLVPNIAKKLEGCTVTEMHWGATSADRKLLDCQALYQLKAENGTLEGALKKIEQGICRAAQNGAQPPERMILGQGDGEALVYLRWMAKPNSPA